MNSNTNQQKEPAMQAVETRPIYAAYYRTKPRTSLYETARIVADSHAEAVAKAKAAIMQAYPEGEVVRVFLAKNSPWPVKNADGKSCKPSEVY